MNRILTVIYNLVGTARVKIVRKKTMNAHYLNGMADIDLSFNGHNSLVSYEEELNRHFDDFEMDIEEEMGRRQSMNEMFAQLHRYRRNVTDKLLMLFPSQNKEQFLFERVVIEKSILLNEKPEKRLLDRILLFMQVQERLLKRIELYLMDCLGQLQTLLQLGQLTVRPAEVDNRAESTNDPSIWKWNNSKSNLLELIYGIYLAGLIVNKNNEQKATLDSLVQYFSQQFNVNLPQPQGLLAALKRRKKEDTSLLQQMQLKIKESRSG